MQVSLSSEHQEFFTFMQRVLSPVLEAYSGAAIFVHSLLSPMTEREYTHKLFKYLLTRTEKGVAAYGQSPAACTKCLFICLPPPIFIQIPFWFSLLGESATHYLVKNTVKTFKELAVRLKNTNMYLNKYIKEYLF